MKLEPGTRIGPYELAGLVGEGGMGVVYRAHDERLQRDVAIKFMSQVFSGDSTRIRLMQQEARAASKLSHPNIVAVFDTGTHAGVMYVVTELLEGESLSALVNAGPRRGAPCWGSRRRSPRACRRRTSTASCIATSSPTTSSSRTKDA